MHLRVSEMPSLGTSANVKFSSLFFKYLDIYFTLSPAIITPSTPANQKPVPPLGLDTQIECSGV